MAKARRGELAMEPPLGYWRRPSGEVVLDPDEQVRTVVELVFAKFEELGTLHAVLYWLVANGIDLGGRQRCGPDRGEVVWRRPNRTVIRNMIHSPVYAGIYAYGRKHTEYHGPGRRERLIKDPADWLVCLPGLLPAYISVEQWERNLARLESNRNTALTAGAPRTGDALLAGLLWCGRCGRRMNTAYRSQGEGGRQLYLCSWELAHYGGTLCQQLVGDRLDEHLSALVLQAIAPAAIEVSLRAAEQLEGDRAVVDRIWRQKLERADYEVDHARRCYRLVEPENRLVSRSLEIEWEKALAAREVLQGQYTRFTDATPRIIGAAERDEIRALAQDLPGLWAAPTTTAVDRKQLLRLVVEKVTVTVIGDSELVDVVVTWAGGHTTGHRIVRTVATFTQLSYYPQLMARIAELATAGTGTRQIVDILNAEGYRPPKRSETFGMQNVRDLMRRQGLLQAQGRTVRRRLDHLLGPDDWWFVDLAAELEIPLSTLHLWVTKGWVDAHHAEAPGKPWIVHADTAERDRLRELHSRPNGYYTRHKFLDGQAPRTASPDRSDPSPKEEGHD